MSASATPGTAVSFIVPAYNEAALLGATLGRINEVRAALPEHASELIVVDNNSTDATAAIARTHGAAVVFAARNCIAAARNAGAAAAAGDILVFIDADTLVTSELVRAALCRMDDGSACGGGTTVAFDRPRIPFPARCFAWAWHRLVRLVPMAAGSFIFCRRRAWADVGGFDERVYASEEVGFSRRVARWGRRRGQRFVVLDIPVVTSARKLDQFSVLRMVATMLLLACCPPLVRSRRLCHIWYAR